MALLPPRVVSQTLISNLEIGDQWSSDRHTWHVCAAAGTAIVYQRASRRGITAPTTQLPDKPYELCWIIR